MGRAYSFLHAAALAVQLPRESRIARIEDEAAGWTDADEMMRMMEHELRTLVWQQTKDGAKGRNAPRPLPSPVEQAKTRRRVERTDIESINRILGYEGGA